MISSRLVLFGCLQMFWFHNSTANVFDNDTLSNMNNLETMRNEAKILENKNNQLIKDKENENFIDAVNIREMGRDQQSDISNNWYTNVPMLPIVFATSTTLPDGLCKKQAQLYLRDLRNGTLWATQMYDSSTKYPDGVINGHTRHFGDFDTCYNLRVKLPLGNGVNSNDDDMEEISGRYCLIDIKYEKRISSPVQSNERLDLDFDPLGSVWEAIREKGDFRRIKRYMLQMALCVPEVCSASDIETALQEPLMKFGNEKNLNLDVSVKPHFCQALKDAPKFSKSAKIYCAVISGLIALVIVSTWYDFTLTENTDNVGSMTKNLMGCFSARRNFKTLMEPKIGHRGLETLHLTRFFLMTLVLYAHRIVEYHMLPIINVSHLEWLYKFKSAMMILGGTVIIEGFLSYSGLLVAYNILRELDKKKKFNFFHAIMMRFFRLTPSYMVIVFFNAYILPNFGSGPYWEWKVGLQRDSCMKNWWTNLLYINNYVNPEMICMFQSWYVAVDFQLYILALIVVYLFWRMPRKIGYSFISIVILSGCIVRFVCTYFYGARPTFRGFLPMQDARFDREFTEHYVKSHERISSYFIGVLVGAVLYDHSRSSWRLGKGMSNILFILLAFVLYIGGLIIGHKYYDPNTNSTLLERVIYACFYRSLFAISACSIPLLITFGSGMDFHYNFYTPRWVQPLASLTYGAYLVHDVYQLYEVGVTRSAKTFQFYNLVHFHYNFYTPRWVQPLASLTYGAYLVHDVYQLYEVGVTRSAKTFQFYNLFWDYIPDVVFAFALSFLLTMIVEMPFRKIERLLLTKRETIESTADNVQTEAKKID